MFVGVKISIKVRCLCDDVVAEIVSSWFCAAEDSVPWVACRRPLPTDYNWFGCNWLVTAGSKWLQASRYAGTLQGEGVEVLG